jgi:predicted nucleotidyltransferase
MIFHDLPETLLAGPARLAVLREVLRAGQQERSGRAIARGARVSVPWTVKSLEVFESLGIVRRRSVPPSDLWQLNPDHALLPRIRRIVGLDDEMWQDFKETLRPLTRRPAVESAVIFGSAARRQETGRSDIDLFIVVPSEKAKARIAAALSATRQAVMRRFGDRLETLVYTRAELRSKRALPLVGSIRADGIALKGELP